MKLDVLPILTPPTQARNPSRPATYIMLIGFVAFLIGPTLVEIVLDRDAGGWRFAREFVEVYLSGDTARLEFAIGQRGYASIQSRRLLSMTAAYKPVGNNVVFGGKDGFLYLTTEMAYASPLVPKVDPTAVPALLDLNRQLAARGIHLVIVAVPMKVSIYPEHVTGFSSPPAPPAPPDRAGAIANLRAGGADFLDLLPDFWNFKHTPGEPLYIPADSHWTPRGVERAATVLADHVRPLLTPYTRRMLTGRATPTTLPTDLRNLLGEEYAALYPATPSSIRVATNAGEPFDAGDDSPVLVVGDSYAYYWSSRHAGLADQLALELGVGVQCIWVVGNGFNQSRAELARHANFLKNKKVVIFEFAERYLYQQRLQIWDKVDLDKPLPPVETHDRDFPK